MMFPEELVQGLARPTAEDILQAEEQLRGTPEASVNPAVFKGQVRMFAYGIAAARQPRPEVDPFAERLEREREVSRVLMERQGKIYQGITLSDPTLIETSVVTLFRNLPPSKRDVLLLGTPGNGKTFGAVAAVASKGTVSNAEGGKAVNAAFITAYKLAEAIWNKDHALLKRLEAVHYLIIDDLGTEPLGWKGEDFRAHFEALYDSRDKNGWTTYMTSNAPLKQSGNSLGIEDIYGERFISRFRRTGVVFESIEGDLRSEKEQAVGWNS